MSSEMIRKKKSPCSQTSGLESLFVTCDSRPSLSALYCPSFITTVLQTNHNWATAEGRQVLILFFFIQIISVIQCGVGCGPHPTLCPLIVLMCLTCVHSVHRVFILSVSSAAAAASLPLGPDVESLFSLDFCFFKCHAF